MILVYSLSFITLLFILLFFIKRWIPFTICVICLSVSGTWALLWLLYHTSVIEDTTLLALLMGQSVLGIYYLVEKRVSKELLIFRLPFLLSLNVVAFMAITFAVNISAILLVMAIWVVIMLLYMYRHVPWINNQLRKLIDCCGKW